MVDVTQSMFNFIGENLSFIWVVLTIIILLTLFNFILRSLKRTLLTKAKSKKQISNIKIFTRMMNITFSVVIILFAIFSYTGSWTGFGVVAGLLTAALGFALQKPITGIAAWIMVIVKRPFNIGDRIKIGEIKGEVYDISLTHIYIDEVGGLINSEELSGRNIMVPNYLLFEQSIINYTMINDYILGEVIIDVTYESNLDKAIEIALEAANKYTKDFHKIKHKPFPKVEKPYTRLSFEPSGINVNVRYSVPVKSQSVVSSDITKEVYTKIKKTKDVHLAYPHTEVILRKK